MELEEIPPPDKTFHPKVLQEPRHSSQKAQEKESHRTGQKEVTLEEPPIYGPKEKQQGGPSNIRSVNPKHLHQMSNLQDVNYEGNQATPSHRLLDGITGCQGRILARPYIAKLPQVPGVHIQGSGLAIQSNAIRAQYSSTHLHQAGLTRGETPVTTRYLVSPLPRRPSDNRKIEEGLSNTLSTSSEFADIPGLDHQLQEVSINPRPGVRMVRRLLRFKTTYSTVPQRQTRERFLNNFQPNTLQNLLNSRGYEASRSSKLDWAGPPVSENYYDRDKVYHQTVQKIAFGPSNYNEQVHETQSLQMVQSSPHPSASWKPHTRRDYNVRCFTSRLGVPNQRDSLPGHLRRVNVLLDQRSGTADSLVLTAHGKYTREQDSGSVRQLHSSGSDQERNINLANSVSPSTADMEESRELSVGPENSPHKRELQCLSRPTIQEPSNLDRMVPPQEGFSENLEDQPTPPSGLVCNEPEQQAQDICLTLPGQAGNSPGLTNSSMGRVGPPLSIPPNSFDFQGFGKDPAIQLHLSNFNNARDANETLVYGSTTTEYSVQCLTDNTSTSGGRSISQNEPTFHASRLGVIRGRYEERFSQCDTETLDLMSKPIASSSLRDYQNKWESFIGFLHKQKIRPFELNISHVLRFLTFLFKVRKLKPRTISCYRAAIAEPLLHGFNINTNTKEVCDLIRGMKLRRPADPPSQPSWSLNKVLSFLVDMKEPISDIWILRKAAFLLSLATGYRVSELQACVRDEDLCSIKEDMSLTIRPHHNFIAKNENSQKRWPFKEIKPLLENGSPSKLCAVRALQDYLHRTSNIKRGYLFRSPRLKSKELSTTQLSRHICAVILAADPHAKAKTHDIRKFAASYSLMKTMRIDDIVKEVGWRSKATFIKHYLFQTEELERNVSLPLA